MTTGFFVFGKTKTNSCLYYLAINDSTSKALKKVANKDARRATILSAVLPGAGQIYNRKYWKVPLIYAAFGGFGYFYVKNNAEYLNYKTALVYRYDDDASTVDSYPFYSSENLVVQKKTYKKRKDLCLVGIGVTYLLNIIDANVDAHLKGFNKSMDEKITFTVKPCSDVVYTLNKPVYFSGLQFKLRF